MFYNFSQREVILIHKRTIILALSLLLLLSFSLVATTQSESDKLPEDKLIEYMKKRVVQIGVSTTVHYRSWEWKKETTYNDNGEKEEKWKAIKGDWEEEKEVFHCSGCIVYSGERKPLHPDTDEKLYGHTLILTNYHCLMPLLEVKDEVFGTRFDPVKIYDKGDLKTVKDYGNWFEPQEDAKAIAEQYITINDRRPIIKHKKDQNYSINGLVETYDARLDIGVIRLNNVYPIPEADFSEDEPTVGQQVWIGGAPLAIPFSYDKGRVNQTDLDIVEGDDLDIGWLDQVKLDIAGAPGSSGSAIFNEQGEIEAVLHGSFLYGKWGSVQGGQLAINAQNIKEWLRWNGYSYALED